MVIELVAGWLVNKGLDAIFTPKCDLCNTHQAAGETPCCGNDLCSLCLNHVVKTGFFGGMTLKCPFCGTKTKL
jgi:hypothetical protein